MELFDKRHPWRNTKPPHTNLTEVGKARTQSFQIRTFQTKVAAIIALEISHIKVERKETENAEFECYWTVGSAGRTSGSKNEKLLRIQLLATMA